ncbi:MAG: SRPBCC family protein [Myxococcota bacterium]
MLDPASGTRRRHLFKDKAVHAGHVSANAARKTATDLRHRTEGFAASMASQLDETEVGDGVIHERVRSVLGTVSSHPGAIEVHVDNGHVTLTGPVLGREAQRVVRKVAHVHGVHGVTDNLARYKSSEHVSSLQGGRRREPRSEFRQTNWAPAPRLVAGIAGMGLGATGLRMQGLLGGIATGLGSVILLRAVTNMPVQRIFGVAGGRRGIDVRKDIHIQAPVEEVFEFFRHLENWPKFMTHLKKVETRGERTWWEAAGPAGIPVHWEAVITHFEPNKRIAWKSLPGSFVRNAGFIRFDQDHKGTLVEIQMTYNPVGGVFSHAVASLFGADPKHAFDEDLQRMKSMIERGKTTTKGHEVTREELAQHDGAGGPPPPSTEA